MKKNLINKIDLKRGLSGCFITISENGNLIKKSSTKEYNNRLKKQSEKQKLFHDYKFSNIVVPKIIETYYEDGLFTIEMDYIYAENETNFFNHASISHIEQAQETIDNFLKEMSSNSDEFNFSENIYNKLNELKINTNHKDLINLLSKFCESRNIILPHSLCHGDLTLANVLFQEKNIILIDFLDSYMDSFFVDIIKLKQDLFYLWNSSLNDSSSVRLKIIYKQLWGNINKNYYEYLQSRELKILDTLNFLRIEPYIKTLKHRKLIDCILVKLHDEVKCII